jgi:hypothetical protein
VDSSSHQLGTCIASMFESLIKPPLQSTQLGELTDGFTVWRLSGSEMRP